MPPTACSWRGVESLGLYGPWAVQRSTQWRLARRTNGRSNSVGSMASRSRAASFAGELNSGSKSFPSTPEELDRRDLGRERASVAAFRPARPCLSLQWSVIWRLPKVARRLSRERRKREQALKAEAEPVTEERLTMETKSARGGVLPLANGRGKRRVRVLV